MLVNALFVISDGVLIRVSIGTVTVALNRTFFTFQNGESNATLWNSMYYV